MNILIPSSKCYFKCLGLVLVDHRLPEDSLSRKVWNLLIETRLENIYFYSSISVFTANLSVSTKLGYLLHYIIIIIIIIIMKEYGMKFRLNFR